MSKQAKILLFICVFLGVSTKADNNIFNNINGLWAKYAESKSNAKRVNVLLKLGYQYLLLDKQTVRDSLYDIAVENSVLDDTLLFQVCESYFSVDYHYLSGRKALQLAKNTIQIAKNNNDNTLLYRSYACLTRAYIVNNNIDSAVENVNRAYYHVSQINNDVLKAQCMLLMGGCKELENKKIEAFRNYTDALLIAEKNLSNDLKFDCYQKLSSFYYFLKKYDKSLLYKKQQFNILNAQKHPDSNKLMDLNINLADILYHKGEILQAENVTKTIIKYAKDNNCEQLKNTAFGLYRTYLVDNALFSDLRDLYEKQYPEEYKQLAQEDTTLYYRLNGYILEANGKQDSAAMYYAMAEKRLQTRNGGNIPLSNFYKRYGEFLLRHNNEQMALQKFDSAYKYALAANYFPYLVESTHYLDSLSYMEGNMKDAYHYAGLNKMYSDKQAAINKGEEMLQLEVENEARQQELRAEMDRKATERRYNLQYTAMVIAIIGIFILLATLGTFKVHPTYIRILGFFSFIFFFEFIIMIADHQIHDFTHGEPWKFMAFKIVLIAILLPLHHWLEEKVIHYLVHHHMMSAPKMTMKIPGFGRKKSEAVVEEKPSDN
ncbi:MAG: hypothetical protein BGO69_17725 [Bacteroidetes bacterium 46-16]|nr:MAG: hypothetical protein BGO69_17725 [Bacteroidetes bacterium 46-16]